MLFHTPAFIHIDSTGEFRNNMRKHLVVLAITALVLSGCSFNVKLPPLTSQSATESTAAAELIELSITQTNESAVEIAGVDKLTYPKFSVSSGGDVGQKISDAINAEISLQVKDFEKQAADAISDPSGGSTFELVVRDLNQTKDYVLYNLFNCQYISGAAHGYCFGFTQAYSATTGSELSLIGAIDPAKRQAFYDFIEESLFIQTDPYYLFEPDYIDLGKNSFNSWSISYGSVKIQFAPYEVGPYGSGEIELYLEASQLAPYFAEDSELVEILKAGS